MAINLTAVVLYVNIWLRANGPTYERKHERSRSAFDYRRSALVVSGWLGG